MAQLNDREIRPALLKHLRGLAATPKAILEEIRVHNGNAIADVVAVHRIPHCYEIKGETDAIGRLDQQGPFYDQAFLRITLVTTENHLAQAQRVTPAHWGIMVADRSRDVQPSLRYIRGATDSPKYNKEVALLTLWKCELLTALSESQPNAHKLSRSRLTQLIAETQPGRSISALIGERLVNRQANNGWSIAM